MLSLVFGRIVQERPASVGTEQYGRLELSHELSQVSAATAMPATDLDADDRWAADSKFL